MTGLEGSPVLLYRPLTLADAQARLRDVSDAVPLAGGQHLVPRWRDTAMPPAIVSLGSIAALRRITVDDNGLSIGSGTSLQDVATSALVQHRLPALAGLAARMGDRLMRNRATIGGALCTTHEAGCLPAALLGTGALLHTTAREIPASDWFCATGGAPSLAPGELITRITLPQPVAASHQCLRLTPGRFALVTVFASKGTRGLNVGVSGLQAWPFRALAAESWLAQGDLGAGPALDRVFADCSPRSDVQASGQYRLAQAQALLQAAGLALSAPTGA